MTATSAAHAAVSSAPVGGHLWHLIGGAAFFLLSLGGVAISERSQRTPARHSRSVARSALLVAMVVAGVGAAAVHFAVMPEHFAEATMYGTFFAVVATAQVGYSLLLVWRPSRVLVAAGVSANLIMVSLWLITRTIGIPLGPEAGSIEPFGVLDILASGFEMVVVVLGVLTLLRAARPRAASARVSLPTPRDVVARELSIVRR